MGLKSLCKKHYEGSFNLQINLVSVLLQPKRPHKGLFSEIILCSQNSNGNFSEIEVTLNAPWLLMPHSF